MSIFSIRAQPAVERTAQILLDAHEDALARRYLTEQAQWAAGDGLRLIEALADSIEARTKVLHGIRSMRNRNFLRTSH
jgi:hypothetical protein